MAGSLGLPVLLSRVLGGITNDLEQAEKRAGNGASLAVWSNVLRGVGDGCSERDLALTTRISKRLAVAAVTGCARVGWVTAVPGSKGRHVTLTDAGRADDVAWRKRLAALDKKTKGTDLRGALEELVGQFSLEHPWFPSSYGAADPSAVGGSFVRPKPGEEGPAHGVDWKPVRRGAGDTVSSVPLTGLLSQALMQFTIDYEARPMWPLSSTTLVVQHLPVEPTSLADVPGDHGITGDGKSLLERHGVATADKKTKLVQLTPLGAQMREHHAAFVADIETQWQERYGKGTVKALRKVLTAHPSAKDSSLPDHITVPLNLG